MITIVGILAAIAVPQYTFYTQKAKFTEVITATTPFKMGVEVCVASQGLALGAAIVNCSNGLNGVPNQVTLTAAGSVVASISASDAGIITAMGTASVGSYSYILIPVIGTETGSALLTWDDSSGTCKPVGMC